MEKIPAMMTTAVYPEIWIVIKKILLYPEESWTDTLGKCPNVFSLKQSLLTSYYSKLTEKVSNLKQI